MDSSNSIIVGTFVAEAVRTNLSGQEVVGVWTDGVMLSCDNPASRFGVRAFELEAGQNYRVTVEKLCSLELSNEIGATDESAPK